MARPTLCERLFGVDPRSLAAFRVVLGVLVLCDLYVRSLSLADHYTDWGVLPRSLLAQVAHRAHLGLHALSGDAVYEGLLFAVAAALAVAYVLGYRCRVVAVLLWALTVSLQNRNEIVNNKGDQILRLLLFWSMFLPIGAVASLDARRARAAGRWVSSSPVLSLATAALLLQAGLVWFVSAVHKTGDDWFPDGTAVYYALQLDFGATRVGLWLRDLFVVTKVMTYGTLALEWAALALLFFPFRTATVRGVAIVSLAMMHGGIAACMAIGLFPAFSLASLLPFVPGAWWDRLGLRAGAAADAELAPARSLPWSSRWSLGAVVPAAALAAVLWTNAASVEGLGVPTPPWLDTVLHTFRLDQEWTMYAPYPSRVDGWFETLGTRPGAPPVDVLRRLPAGPSGEKPGVVSETFPSERWRRYLMMLTQDRYAVHRDAFSRYLCRRYNDVTTDAAPIEAVEVVFDRQLVEPDYRPRRLERIRLSSLPCPVAVH